MYLDELIEELKKEREKHGNIRVAYENVVLGDGRRFFTEPSIKRTTYTQHIKHYNENAEVEKIEKKDLDLVIITVGETIEEQKYVPPPPPPPDNSYHHKEKYANCTKYFNEEGQLHRDEGKPAIEYDGGEAVWYENGKFIKKIAKDVFVESD